MPEPAVRALVLLLTLSTLLSGCLATPHDTFGSAPGEDGHPGDGVDAAAEDTGWAVPPDDIGIGSTLVGTFVCGFFENPAVRHFTFKGEVWDETTPLDQGGDAGMLEGTEHCLTDGLHKYLDWYVDSDEVPFIYLSGGLHHDMRPSPTPGAWNGRVYPVDGPNEECLAALDQHGLTLPVGLVFTVESVDLLEE